MYILTIQPIVIIYRCSNLFFFSCTVYLKYVFEGVCMSATLFWFNQVSQLMSFSSVTFIISIIRSYSYIYTSHIDTHVHISSQSIRIVIVIKKWTLLLLTCKYLFGYVLLSFSSVKISCLNTGVIIYIAVKYMYESENWRCER